jgi:hypothetical protein
MSRPLNVSGPRVAPLVPQKAAEPPKLPVAVPEAARSTGHSPVDQLIDGLATSPAELAKLQSIADPQQRSVVALTQRLEQQALLSTVLANTLDGRRPGAPLTDLQTKLLSRIEDPAMRGIFTMKLAVQDGPLSTLSGRDIDSILSAPTFSPTEQQLLGAIDDPTQRALQSLQMQQQKQAVLGTLLGSSLDGRKAGAPLTELQQKLLNAVESPAVRAAFTLRQAAQDGAQSKLKGADIDALLSLPLLSPIEQQLLAKTDDPKQRSLLNLQLVNEKQSLLGTLLADTLDGRQAGAPRTELQQKLFAAVESPSVRATFQLREAIQDGPRSKLKGADIDALLSVPMLSRSETAMLGAIDDPQQRNLLSLQMNEENQAVLGTLLNSTLAGRTAGAPRTELQQKLLNQIQSPLTRSMFELRTAAQDGPRSTLSRRDLEALLSMPRFAPDEQALLASIDDPTQRAMLELQKSLEHETLMASVLADTLPGRAKGSPISDLQQGLLGQLSEPQRAMFMLSRHLQDGGELPPGQLGSMLNAVTSMSPAEQRLLGQIESPTERAAFAAQRFGQQQRLLTELMSRSLEAPRSGSGGMTALQRELLMRIDDPAVRNRFTEQLKPTSLQGGGATVEWR